MAERVLPNQIFRKLLGPNSLNPFDQYDSSARKQMIASHIGQALTIKRPTRRRIQTGMEQEYGKYTFSTKMPDDGTVLKLIPRYRQALGGGGMKLSPQTILIYENHHTHELGIVDLRNHFSDQNHFGFEYKKKDILNHLHSGGMAIPKDTIFMDSPNVMEDGDYMLGRECNVAFMSIPAVAEDGIAICEDVLDDFTIKTYEKIEVEWGSHSFPLNLYGDDTTYKIFPDIGDRIREDGILIALRREEREPNDPSSIIRERAIIDQSVRALQTVDPFFDRRYYSAGPGGRIVDIRIYHDNLRYSTSPEQMEEQVRRYYSASRQFYQEIVDEYKKHKHARGEGLRLTPEFHRLIVEAYSVLGLPNANQSDRVNLLYRKTPVDEWRAEFIIEYEVTPTIGFKLTDLQGAKGVNCAIMKREDMPVDADGNSADIIVDPYSTISRMIGGRPYEPYLNACGRDLVKRMHVMVPVDTSQSVEFITQELEEIKRTDPARFESAWQWLLGYVKEVSPDKMYLWLTSGTHSASGGSPAGYMAKILKEGFILYLPTEHEVELHKAIGKLSRSAYHPTYGPVSYVGASGRRVTTKTPVLIGSMYIVLLEKIADDWAAVSSARRQAYGVLSPITAQDKHTNPTRVQPIRTWGESELRIGVSFAGARAMADLMDRNNNPRTHRMMVDNILRAEQPTHIEELVDRTLIPYGNSRSLQLTKHMAECAGWRFTYTPYHNPHSPATAPVVRHTHQLKDAITEDFVLGEGEEDESTPES